MAVEVGVRVVRGPDWSWEDQDGGEGSIGTLVEVKEVVPKEEETSPSGTTVKVCWDIGVLSNYRCGFDEKYDLRVFDNAQTGVSHRTVTCDDCMATPLYGMRWKCAACHDYDLCTECYMSDKHSLEHRFLRYDSPDSEGFPVSARSGSRRVQAKGFFKGAVVSRGKDWNWGDQDGGIGKAGILKVLKGWRTESYRSVGEIQWESSDTNNIYRLGHKGKVDLKCDTPGDGGQYYPGHLPVAGASLVSNACNTTITTDVTLDPTSVTTPAMGTTTATTTTMTTTAVSTTSMATTTMTTAAMATTIMTNAAMTTTAISTTSMPTTTMTTAAMTTTAVTTTTRTTASKATSINTAPTNRTSENVRRFRSGDVVRVIDDPVFLRELQRGHGEWSDGFLLILGQVGQVLDVLDSGDCTVKVNGFFCVINPQALIPAPGETPPIVPVVDHSGVIHSMVIVGEADSLRTFLSQQPGRVDDRSHGRTALHNAVGFAKVDVVRVLLEYGANVDAQDSNGVSCLSLACYKQFIEIIEMLLEAGANPGIADMNDFNSLHICAKVGCLKGCELIVKKYPKLLNVRKEDGYGPLHLACLNDNYSVVKFLLEQEKHDIDAITGDVHTVLHLAADLGHLSMVELLVGHGIDLNVVDGTGLTALHRVLGTKGIVGITDDSPELSKICSTLSDLPSAMVGSAAVACLLVREGADLYCTGQNGPYPLELCKDELLPHLLRFAGERSTFYGSLRKSPKPTSADLVEEEDRHTPQKTVEEPPKPQEEHEPVKTTIDDRPIPKATPTDTPISETTPTDTPIPEITHTNTPITKTTPTDTPIPQTMSSVQPVEDEACLLCDKPIDVRIKPCGHTVLCRSHANTAKRCPQCRGPIHFIDDLDPLCGMCQERRCTVTLKPCDHMMCEACASLMKRCFECKEKITAKVGHKDSSSSEQSTKPQSDPAPITTTDSREPISDEDHLCEICCTSRKDTAFMCGHQLCYDCSLKVDNCPICRQEIKHRIKLH